MPTQQYTRILIYTGTPEFIEQHKRDRGVKEIKFCPGKGVITEGEIGIITTVGNIQPFIDEAFSIFRCNINQSLTELSFQEDDYGKNLIKTCKWLINSELENLNLLKKD